PAEAPPEVAQAPDVTAVSGDAPDDASPPSEEVIEITDAPPPGSKSSITRETLERNEFDDVHKVLGGTAGVYVRDEDGYGLRPNIGMRGAAADRSSKITLMEDGVLIAPAPYSAPAAYYTPLVTRMSRIDVTKGPAAIKFGPNTVGGAVDYIGEPFPARRAGYVDVGGGSDRYGKVHMRAAERFGKQLGLMGEVVKLRTDGFKQLDGGGDTGFDKNDVQLTAHYNSLPAATQYHTLDVRLGYGTERSNETYTGISDADFALQPQRRYMASQLDQMNWNHWRMRATHRLELGTNTRIETVAYRHRFHRKWGKVDGFIGQRDFYDLIEHPDAGANAIFYQILTGQADSSSPEEQLILGTNDRRFTSQGIQTTFTAERTTGSLAHQIDVGVRVHFDRADRRRFEDAYDMMAGSLVRTARPQALVLDSRAETIALAPYAQDTVRWKNLEVTGGLRVELIDYRFQNQMNLAVAGGNYAVVIPGGGVQYHATRDLTFLAGVHRGFVPVAPTAAAEVNPESSVSYEAGMRYRHARWSLDAIGFYSDYANLKGSCSLASGCTETQEGQEFNGGAARVWGAEAQFAAEPVLDRRRKVTLPLAAAYTLTQSEFLSDFDSEFAGWGRVKAGYELPYLPHHQLSVTTAVKTPRFELGAMARYRGESRDVAGEGDIATGVLAQALFTIDLTAHARLHDLAELYATCSNLLDEQVIISRRPYGARPNPPRMIALGYKARF
ncbi:MAG: TonB-dependent receptor, partial [Deltaproteobacteria bacterium]|nr:TonB-dependent receptor [Deltaproteobacteria bacterium]